MAISNSTIGHGITVNVDARGATAVVRAVRPDPAADAEFVGRDRELTELLALLAPDSGTSAAASAGGVVVVSAVAGAPGVGKTALAQTAARAATARGWFPGGAVSADLHGYDPDPAAAVYPTQLYAALLRALDLPGKQILPTESDQATAYHQLLDDCAAAARPVLLVLDNISDPDQVADVLPRGVGGHRVLITSRDTLAALPDARLLNLHILDPDAAVALLTVGLRRRHPSDTRVTDDPDAAIELVELCGRLPLAVQIVAALLGDEPDRPLADITAELADEGHRLRALDYSGRWAVRTAFDLSYRRLRPSVGDLFGLLSAAPSLDVGLGVAAALVGQPEPVTRAGLRRLCRANLLEQLPALLGQEPRWRMHDLIRLYAAEQLTDDQRAAAFTRVLSYYQRSAEHYYPRSTDLAVRHSTTLSYRGARHFIALTASVYSGRNEEAIDDKFKEAMRWVVVERVGLIGTVTHAAVAHREDAAALAAALAPLLERAWESHEFVTIAAAGAQASNDIPDHDLRARSWNNLGIALQYGRRLDEAITAFKQAEKLFHEAGDRRGAGIALHGLGVTLVEAYRFDEAITAFQQAGKLFHEAGDRRDEAVAQFDLGLTLQEAQRFDEAIIAHQQAGKLFREAGDRYDEAAAWDSLGEALTERRRFYDAITAHRRAADIFRKVRSLPGEANAQINLGLALEQVKLFNEAVNAHQRVVEIFDRRDYLIYGEGEAWYRLGKALAKVGRFDEAITAYKHAEALFTRSDWIDDDQRLLSNSLGLALREVGRFDEALRSFITAKQLFARLDDSGYYRQAQVMVELGQTYVDLGDVQRARHEWAAAADLYTAVGAADDAVEVLHRIANLDR